MHVTLIKPRIGHRGMERYVDAARMEPLQMAVLAAMFPPDWQLRFYDDRCDMIPFEDFSDAVFITVETFTALRAYEIAGIYRRKNIPVIMGGMHPTLIPEETLQHADSIFTGDAEYGFSGLCNDLENNHLQKVYRGGFGKPQANLLPRRDIFAGKGYLPVSLLQAGRGCAHECSFCATSRFFNGTNYMRPVDEIIEEIKRDCGKVLFFVDDNFIANPDLVKELLAKLIPLKRYWVTQVTGEVADDPEMLRLMQRSGCMGFVVGFESINESSLSWMNKSHNLNEKGFDRYQKQLEAFRKHNLNIWAAFSLGHDFDTVASIRATGRFASENRFAFAAFNILTPYPSTPLYDSLQKEGRLLYNGKWWTAPEYRFNHAVFKPANMSANGLTRVCWEIRRKFNTTSMIIKRASRFKTDIRNLVMLLSYLQYCRIFRQEIYRKQGLSLGAGIGNS